MKVGEDTKDGRNVRGPAGVRSNGRMVWRGCGCRNGSGMICISKVFVDVGRAALLVADLLLLACWFAAAAAVAAAAATTKLLRAEVGLLALVFF